MTLHHAITLLACVGELAFAVLALSRANRSPLALPLAALSLTLFFWNLGAVAFELSGFRVWHVLDVVVSPLSAPLTLHFILVFVGLRRRLSWVLWAAYALLGALSAVTLWAALQGHSAWVGGELWARWHLIGVCLVLGVAVGLLLRHARQSGEREEAARVRLIILAVTAVGALCATELIADAGWKVPRLGAVGTLAGNLVLVLVALRLRLFGRPLAGTAVLGSAAVALLAILLYAELLQYVGTQQASLALATATVTLAVAVAVFQGVRALRSQRERLTSMATLGRFSAQMAHDLKNPLAALQGAVEYVGEELARGHALSEQLQFIQLMHEQVQRLRGTVDRYQRVGRMEPHRVPVGAEVLVERVLGLEAFGAARGVRIERQVEPQLPRLLVDEDLVSAALENLLRNALEAGPSDGGIVMGARRTDVGEAVELWVQDSGTGMDARTVEHAFDDFFTTKAQGSGLGLAFVRRVMEAHGGEVRLASRLGRGTTVRMVFPLSSLPP